MNVIALFLTVCFSQEPVLAVQAEPVAQKNPFDKLPDEMILQILEYVDDFRDIANCLRVDERLKRLMLYDLSQYDLDLPDRYDPRNRGYNKSDLELRVILSRLTDEYLPLTVLLNKYNIDKIITHALGESTVFELYDPGDDRELPREVRKILSGKNPPNIVKLHITYDKPGFEFWIKHTASTLRELTLDYDQTLFLQLPIRIYLLNQLFSQRFPLLEKLTLSQIELNGADLLNFVRYASHFPSLVDLDLSSNNLNSQAFNLFAHSSLLSQLRRLDLSRTQISSDKLAYFIRFADLGNLEYLSIADTGTVPEQTLDPRGSIRIQLDNSWKIYWNWRYHNPVQQDIDLRLALQSARNLGNLRELDLSGTHVYEGRGPEIMEYASLPSLRILRLNNQTRIKLETPESDADSSSVYSVDGPDIEVSVMS